MGCCIPNNRTNNLIISNIPKNDLQSTYKLFNNKDMNDNHKHEDNNENNNNIIYNNNEDKMNN